MKRITLLILALCFINSTAFGQAQFLDETFAFDKDKPQVGFFIGNVNISTSPPKTVVAVLNVTKSADGLSVRLTLPGAAAMNKECVAISATGSKLTFQVVGAGGTYAFKGEIDADGQRFSGQVAPIDKTDDAEEQSSLECRRTLRPTDLPKPLAFTGDLSVQGIKLGMTIVLAQTPGGNWVGQRCEICADFYPNT